MKRRSLLMSLFGLFVPVSVVESKQVAESVKPRTLTRIPEIPQCSAQITFGNCDSWHCSKHGDIGIDTLSIHINAAGHTDACLRCMAERLSSDDQIATG